MDELELGRVPSEGGPRPSPRKAEVSPAGNTALKSCVPFAGYYVCEEQGSEPRPPPPPSLAP